MNTALADSCVMPDAMQALAAPRFSALGAPYVQPVAARPLPDARLLYLNTGLAQDLGLEPSWGESPAALPLLAGNAPWPGQTAFASAYAGHQFGAWVPRLGDGRVLTLAE
ncbi:MAG: protein adenylyltransferase SelO family protein, partial [Rhodoferax sp.]|nr:protein adenylyltransferase SelO family protein [Rhodoferax sp.]